MNQLERIEGQLVIIQWRRGALDWLGMAAERDWGELVIIQWRGEVLSWLGMAAEGGWGRLLRIQWRCWFLSHRPGRLFIFEVVMDFDQVRAGLTDNAVFAVVGGCLHWSGSSVE